MMAAVVLREQLYKQIKILPDDTLEYVDWSDEEWQEFTLQQFFRMVYTHRHHWAK